MKKAIVFLANGFEEMEALGTVDILRRGGIEVTTVSITTDPVVIGAHNVPVTAYTTLNNALLNDADALILPGGMPGASNLNDSEAVKEALLGQYREGRIVAAICAAPMVLGGLGLLKGRKATCYPGFEPKLIGANVTGEAVEVSDNVITGKGPGLVMNFGLALVAAIKNDAVAEEVAFVRKRSVHIDRRCSKSPYSHLWCENRTVLRHLPSFTNCKHSVTIPEYRPPLPFIFRYHIKDTERKFWCKCPFRLPLHQFYQKEYAVR